jgi:hypothetical protein
VNFLLHRHLAASELGSPIAGVGAMLPDLWRMVERRVRARRTPAPKGGHQRALAQGVVHHLDADDWFHACPVFREGERRTIDAFRPLGLPKLGLFAHASWEMCLDGALVRRGRLQPLAAALGQDLKAVVSEQACALAEAHGAEGLDRAARARFSQHMGRLWAVLAEPSGTFVAGYASGEGLAARLGRMRAHFGLAPPSPGDHAELARILDARLDRADVALDELLALRGAS